MSVYFNQIVKSLLLPLTLHRDREGRRAMAFLASVILVLAVLHGTTMAAPGRVVVEIVVSALHSFFFLYVASILLIQWLLVFLDAFEVSEGRAHFLQDLPSAKNRGALALRFCLVFSLALLLGFVMSTAEQAVGALAIESIRIFLFVILMNIGLLLLFLLLTLLAAERVTYQHMRLFWTNKVVPVYGWRSSLRLAAALVLPVWVGGATLATILGVLFSNLRGFM